MIRKNSTYVRMLLPILAIMLIQSLLIGSVLFVNGTIESLEDSAIETMRKNMENRSITLENMMARNWSNLSRLEAETLELLKEQSGEYGMEALLKDTDKVNGILDSLSGTMISTLRQTSTTGIFLYFTDPAGNEAETTCRGLYYRDLDPILTPADFSDLQFLRGPVAVARKDNIPMDSLWSETFRFSPENETQWRGYSELLQIAAENAEIGSANLSLWNWPHFANPESRIDSNSFITYSRPLLLDGKPVGVIGTEIQSKYLKEFFPAGDFGVSGQGGYILLSYNREMEGNELTCRVHEVTGAYVNRMLGSDTDIRLVESGKGVYAFSGGDYEDARIVLQPLTLYNSNTPYSNEQWALAAIGTDNMLLESSQKVQSGILLSSTLAFVLGAILLLIAIRGVISPLFKLTEQIEKNSPDMPIVMPRSTTYEISLLCATLNDMKKRQQKMDAALREERERYLLALESATDIFVEYDVSRDSMMLYYFDGSEDSSLRSQVINDFTALVEGLAVCPGEDVHTMMRFLSGGLEEQTAIRINAELFPHISDVEPDGEFYWFLIKAKILFDRDGAVKKVIGNARQITEEKRHENALLEARRRDTVTGLYNREYGMELISSQARELAANGRIYSICLIHLNDLELLEAYYGRAFTAVIVRNFSAKLLSILEEEEISVRLWNDEIVIFSPDKTAKEAEDAIAVLRQEAEDLYAGENHDLRLVVSIGAASSSGDTADAAAVLEMAGAAMLDSRRRDERLYHDEALRSEGEIEFTESRRPVSVAIEISKANIVSVVFEIFERTRDIPSAINIVLGVLGDVYSLDQVIMCSYDSDFDTHQVTHQWHRVPGASYSDKVEIIPHEDHIALEAMLNEDDTLLYGDEMTRTASQGVKTMLCAVGEGEFSGFCCVMYENGLASGRVLFRRDNREGQWPEEDKYSLHEVSKIISARLSIEKSNNASKAKSEFLSRVSHEIRTPMNAIIGMTGIAKETADNKIRLADCLDKIDFSAKHLLSLINDVLDMSRIESGKLQIDCHPFSLHSFLNGLEILMRSQIESKGITFEVNRDFRHDFVAGDEYRLRQVMVNLLGNASKFTEAGGSVILTIEEVEESEENSSQYRISVKDTGIGISQEDQAKVFKAFEQAKTGDKQKIGTGLGLAISSSIIAAMGSKIKLASDLGAGAEFFFLLTLPHAENAEKEAALSGTDYRERLVGKRVLLVEDNAINLEIAQFVLQDTGLLVESAGNGKEAVELFLESEPGRYDIILMDIQMPIMNGLEATREIRKNMARPDARTIPIVAMTANAFDEDMKISIESGMNGHITKPIDNKKLYELIDKLLTEQEEKGE